MRWLRCFNDFQKEVYQTLWIENYLSELKKKYRESRDLDKACYNVKCKLEIYNSQKHWKCRILLVCFKWNILDHHMLKKYMHIFLQCKLKYVTTRFTLSRSVTRTLCHWQFVNYLPLAARWYHMQINGQLLVMDSLFSLVSHMRAAVILMLSKANIYMHSKSVVYNRMLVIYYTFEISQLQSRLSHLHRDEYKPEDIYLNGSPSQEFNFS